MANVRVMTRDGSVHGLDFIDTVKDGPDPVWIDVSEPDEESLGILADAFGLHPLAIEDCLHGLQRPKMDEHGEMVFIIWVNPNPADLARPGDEIEFFLSDRLLISVHEAPSDAIEAAWSRDGEVLEMGTAWVLHAILDGMVDGYMPLLEDIGDELDEIEDSLLSNPAQALLSKLMRAKRSLVALRRIVGPEWDVLRQIARHSIVSREAYMYFQDVGDHMGRVSDMIDTYRDVATGAMDIYLSAVSNRLNAIMRTLTIVATIFMPLTLLSGIYGMNFRYMPELQQRWGYPAVLLLMVAVAVSMVAWFRKRDWF